MTSRPTARRGLRVLFIGGGTGGHLVPGVAVARELVARGHEPRFLIAGRPVEHDVMGGWRRHVDELLPGPGGRPAPWRLDRWCAATARYRRVLGAFDPDVVVVLGGWVALPVVPAGFGGRASALLEQNARPGRVQRWLGGRVDLACLAFDAPDMPRGRRRTCVTGNPVALGPAPARDEAARRLGLDPARRTLLVMGGSQGAADVNALVPELRAVLAATGDRWQLLHLAGRQRRADAVETGEVPVHEHAFLEDMDAAYALADVVVARAGGTTVAELAATGTPAVFVPYPYHADRHQAENARWLVERGAALVAPDDDPTGRRTVPALLGEALGSLGAMAAAARTLGRPGAAAEVTDELEAIA